MLPSRSRPLTSIGESGVEVALDRTNSITGNSAHWMARCKIEVPSVRALGSESDVLAPSASLEPDCSRIALDMAAVSPLRSDSNTRNSLTDCSIDPPLTVGDVGDAGCWLLLLSLGPPDVDMAGGMFGCSFFERLRWWPVTGELSEACDELGGELLAVLVVLASADVGAPPSVFEVTLLSMFFTLCDLERLCLRVDVSIGQSLTCACSPPSHSTPALEHLLCHGRRDWAQQAPVAGQEARPAYWNVEGGPVRLGGEL